MCGMCGMVSNRPRGRSRESNSSCRFRYVGRAWQGCFSEGKAYGFDLLLIVHSVHEQ